MMQMGKRNKTVLIISLIVITGFFLWRMLRPLNIFVVDERFERPFAVATPKGLSSVSAYECGGCHEEIYREWSESMHAHAWRDPYFQSDFIYDGSKQICLNCHIPLENQQENLVLGFRDREKFNPVLKLNPAYDPVLKDEGVTCAVCHIRDGKIVGPFVPRNAPHPVTVDQSMTSGIGSCERCHVVTGKRWDVFYRVPPCGTVAEITKRGQHPDCIGCHMPAVLRPAVKGGEPRKGRKHLFLGGHSPEMVRNALRVEYKKEKSSSNAVTYTFTLTNIGAAHYLPTGTPDRHLTVELRLLDKGGTVIREKVYLMKRHILWRPFIIDVKDSRLPYAKPEEFSFQFRQDRKNPPSMLDVTVRYHLLEEKRRRRIGYENREPIAYSIYRTRIPLD